MFLTILVIFCLLGVFFIIAFVEIGKLVLFLILLHFYDSVY